MKETELRIGNYLHDRVGRLCIVDCIHNTKQDVYAEGFKAPAIVGPVTSLPHKPILLTKELILSLGFDFEKKALYNKYDAFILDRIWYLSANNGQVFEFGRRITESPEGKEKWVTICLKMIRDVHDLQNLVFALTGHELTVKK